MSKNSKKVILRGSEALLKTLALFSFLLCGPHCITSSSAGLWREGAAAYRNVCFGRKGRKGDSFFHEFSFVGTSALLPKCLPSVPPALAARAAWALPVRRGGRVSPEVLGKGGDACRRKGGVLSSCERLSQYPGVCLPQESPQLSWGSCWYTGDWLPHMCNVQKARPVWRSPQNVLQWLHIVNPVQCFYK